MPNLLKSYVIQCGDPTAAVGRGKLYPPFMSVGVAITLNERKLLTSLCLLSRVGNASPRYFEILSFVTFLFYFIFHAIYGQRIRVDIFM